LQATWLHSFFGSSKHFVLATGCEDIVDEMIDEVTEDGETAEVFKDGEIGETIDA
jgi:hypothetical protein